MTIERTALLNDAKSHTLTFSIGDSTVLVGEMLESTMARADSALYTTKKEGRSRVEMAN